MLKLYKYRSFLTRTDKGRLRSLLENQEIYCSTPDKLNDPYDCNIGTADHLLGHLVKVGVFCLSGPKHNDILLFAHYANQHKGICLEFEVDTGQTIGDSTFLGFAEPVQYVDNFPQFTPQSIHRLPKMKSRVWDYEDEYRVLADLKANSSPFRRFEKTELVGIRFGLRMSESEQRRIQKWAGKVEFPKIAFWKTSLRNDRFCFEYQMI